MGRELGIACAKSWKFSPSNRTRPLSVPIHKYPSAVCAIAETEPPGNPLSLPQRSRLYWETSRWGSRALAARVENTTAPTRNRLNSCCVPKLRLWEVIEFLNHNFIFVLQRILFARNYKKCKINQFVSR